jgi:RND family efflux transporter MFP subunit
MREEDRRGHRQRTRGLRASGAACVAAALAVACSEEAPPEKPVARPVKIFTVEDAGATRTLEYPGQVEASQHADLGFEVPGQIIEFPVDEGQEVEQGQVLARLDPRDYQAELDTQLARERAAQAEYERYRILFEKEVAPEQDFDRARRNYEVTQARVRQASKALEDSVLRAPFSGVVARKLVKDFRNVQAKEPVLILQDDSGRQFVVNVPERDWVYARRGDPQGGSRRLKPRVIVSNYPDREFPAELKEVATTADPATRTFAVTLSFDADPDVNVLPGMTAKARIDRPLRDFGGAFAVPARAVVQDQGEEPYLWKLDPGSLTVSRATVSVGELSGDLIEVSSGLSPGDEIVTSGVHQLREGMQVRRFAE